MPSVSLLAACLFAILLSAIVGYAWLWRHERRAERKYATFARRLADVEGNKPRGWQTQGMKGPRYPYAG